MRLGLALNYTMYVNKPMKPAWCILKSPTVGNMHQLLPGGQCLKLAASYIHCKTLIFVLRPTYSRIRTSIHNENSVIIFCHAPRVLYYAVLLAVIAALTIADDESSEDKCYSQLRPLGNAACLCSLSSASLPQ